MYINCLGSKGATNEFGSIISILWNSMIFYLESNFDVKSVQKITRFVAFQIALV